MLQKLSKKITASFSYAWDGLKAESREYSFRLELAGLALLTVIMLCSPWPWWKTLLMAACYLLIPMAELVNSALENICDLVSPNFSPLVKAAKDKAAAAVLSAIIVNALTLAALLLCPSE